ncbi:hypothetical protein HNO89_002507 [Sporosarcina luteola]|nr:hypothetical protein [Sporosarcina luteola]
MNKSKIILAFLSLTIISTLLVLNPKNSLANDTISKDMDEKVSNKVMEFISKENNFFDLQGSDFEAVLVRELYHSDDSVLAYYYQVKEQGKLKGFVLASAKENIDFILEYGQFSENIDTKYADSLLKNLDKRAYFLGLDFIVFATDKEELTKLVNQKKEEAIESAKENGEDEQYIQGIKNTAPGVDIEKMEYSLKSNVDSLSLSSTVPDVYSLSVTRIWQRAANVANPKTSCGPASGAMIANYYGQVRGFNVRTTPYYANVGTFINHLYFDMNSSLWGTNSFSFLNGLNLHLNHDVNQWEGVRNGEPTFANVINAINQRYPVAYVTRFGNEDYHWRVIKGYNKTKREVTYKDPDGGETNYGDLVVSWPLIEDTITTVYFRLK